MKRILRGLLIFVFLLLLGGAGWILYRKNNEMSALSDRLLALTKEYDELLEEQQELSESFSQLSQGVWSLLQNYLELRGHGTGKTESFTFTESARQLYNPNRGFYHMHGFRIFDVATDFRKNIADRYAEDRSSSLTLIEINLREFREGDVSETGLENLDNLLNALSTLDKQLILRFLYDWEGKNMQYEPDSLEVILRHMEQMTPLLKKYEEHIFLVQGLFVGNVGEMNNSKYLSAESMRRLAEGLVNTVGDNTYLSVRTPNHWRNITGISDLSQVAREDGSKAARIGLYNDGMLGSNTDLGTYGTKDQSQEKPFSQWNRHEELSFQNSLCRIVPNGGEVVIDNEYNDFDSALEDLKTMHVTYLNWDHDLSVLAKWEKTVVREDSCFNGMDGLTYMERHLGYRLVLRETAFDYDWKKDLLTAEITLQNVGFAPIYRKAQVELVLYDAGNGREYAYTLGPEQDIRDLAGGTMSDELKALRWELPLGGMPQGELEIYFRIADELSGETIFLGNEQDPDKRGYRVGTLRLGEAEELLEIWKQELPAMQE